MQLNVNSLQINHQPGYQNVTLPEPVYDQVYAEHQQIPVALRDVKIYVKQIQEGIDKFQENYEV